MNLAATEGAGGTGTSRRPAMPAGRDWAMAGCALLALTAWILCHPYRGIVHDNRLYALLALNYSNPATFARDLFLAHGSQDSFTFFSPLYAAAIAQLGLDWSTRLLVIAGQLLWVACAVALIRRIVARRFTWLALIFLATYPPFYGGNSIFAIAESFLSPRLFVEALGLAALAAYLGGRLPLALALLAAGGLLHPLMIAAPAGVIVLMAITRHRAWWTPAAVVAAGSALLVLALAIAHRPGLALLPAIDAEWKFIVEHRTRQFMLANWDMRDWFLIASDVILVLLACVRASPQVRQLLIATLAIALASLAVSWAGFELLDDLLTGKLQIWRALWLLHALAPVALALLVQDVAARHIPERRLLLALLFGFAALTILCYAALLPSLGICLIILFAALYLSLGKPGAAPLPARSRAIIWLSFGSIVLLGPAYLATLSPFDVVPDSLGLDSALLRRGLSGLAVLLAGALLFSGRAARHARLLAVLAGVALCGTFATWDQRTDWARYMDSTPDIAREFTVPVAPGELVYWPTDVMALWGGLRSPSFYSEVQGAGVIFNRGTAIDYLRRLRLVERFEPASLYIARLLGRPDTNILTGAEARLTLADLVALCRQDDHPDVVVLNQDIAGARRGTWHSPVPLPHAYLKPGTSANPTLDDVGVKYIDEYFVYRCDAIEPGDGQ